ncbi:MAG TPA: THUMP domain-containing protein, partial [Saprospiraceae bacterium]|nr:THUMP domain-containing protein [Saprospiraceae bacterium]
MDLFTLSRRIFITCHNRLAPYVEKEVINLGFLPVEVLKTGIELNGTMADCINLNLNLRCASQVLFSLKTCNIHHPDQLYK